MDVHGTGLAAPAIHDRIGTASTCRAGQDSARPLNCGVSAGEPEDEIRESREVSAADR